jgi:hypothetical protein
VKVAVLTAFSFNAVLYIIRRHAGFIKQMCKNRIPDHFYIIGVTAFIEALD